LYNSIYVYSLSSDETNFICNTPRSSKCSCDCSEVASPCNCYGVSCGSYVSINWSDCGMSSFDLSYGTYSSIRYLNLTRNSLTSLPSNLFSIFSYLYSVDLSYNQLTSISKENVQYLFSSSSTSPPVFDFTGNEITQLPDDVCNITFPSTYNGFALNFSTLQLTSFPKCLTKWSNLHTLVLDGNRLTSVPDFYSPCAITSLRLNRNSLTSIDGDILRRCTSLSYLCINGNRLTNISGVNKLYSLNLLDVGQNNLTNLDDLDLSYSPISTLFLAYNSLTTLPPLDSLTFTKSSLKLAVWHNKLQSIKGEMLRPLRNYYSSSSTLVLSYNELTVLPSSISNEAIKILNVEGNNLTSIPSISGLESLYAARNRITNIKSLSNLYYLDLSYNGLTSVPNNLFSSSTSSYQKNDRVYYFDHNEITSLPEFYSYNYASVLSFSYNNLTTIPVSIGSVKSLSTLWVDHNKIKEIPEDFYWEKLYYFAVNDNNLTSFPAVHSSFWESSRFVTYLKNLYLDNNQLTCLPSGINSLYSLKSLSFSHNLIRVIESMDSLSSLSYLNASYNKISRAPELPKSLLSLDLSNNNIFKLNNANISGLKSLLYVDLGTNLLDDNEINFTKNVRLIQLNLSDNCLNCSLAAEKIPSNITWFICDNDNGTNNSRCVDLLNMRTYAPAILGIIIGFNAALVLSVFISNCMMTFDTNKKTNSYGYHSA